MVSNKNCFILKESRFRPIATQLMNRFGDSTNRRINVKQIAIPNMKDVIDGLSRYENFSMFIPKHRNIAGRLIDILLGTYIFFTKLLGIIYLYYLRRSQY